MDLRALLATHSLELVARAGSWVCQIRGAMAAGGGIGDPNLALEGTLAFNVEPAMTELVF